MFQYLEQGDSKSLQYVIGPDETVDLVVSEMTENNRIRGLLDVRVFEQESGRELRYNTTGLISLEDALQNNRLSKDGLFMLLRAIIEILLDAEDYLIPEERFVFENECIFIRYDNNQTMLLCLPVVYEDAYTFQDFCIELLEGDHFYDEDRVYLTALAQFMEQENFDLKSCMDALNIIELDPSRRDFMVQKQNVTVKSHTSQRERKRKRKRQIVKSEASASSQAASTETLILSGSMWKAPTSPEAAESSDAPIQAPTSPEVAESSEAPVLSGPMWQASVPVEVEVESISAHSPDMLRRSMYESKTLLENSEPMQYSAPKKLLEDGQPTGPEPRRLPPQDSAPQQATAPHTLVRDSAPQQVDVPQGGVPVAPAQPNAYLLRSKTQEKTTVTGLEFRIGKKRELVQYCIPDNPAISRFHASIFFEDGTFYFVDNGSANGSKVEQKPAAKGVKVPLTNGVCIILANEEFYFYCS